ncbi:MAG: PxxKW family cysteine-rich protein [Desulfosarcina sp.]|nr:PxxKW family cysteine-rich protein [Desulfobacterales bacterium]
MICTTIKKDHECTFMTTNGCSYNGGVCHEIVDECKDCNRSAEFPTAWYCTACPEPALKWKNGNCNLATHVSSIVKEKKAHLNPLKASKRLGR